MPLISCNEDITIEFFQKLSRFSNAQTVEQKDVNVKGAMSSVAVAVIEYNDKEQNDLPSSVFLKYGYPLNRPTLHMLPLYKNEVQFYEQFKKDSALLADVYHTEIDEKLPAFTIIMEDLSKSTLYKQEDDLPLEKAEVIMKNLAEFHARFMHKSPSDINNTFDCGILKGNRDPFMKEQGLEWIPYHFGYFYHIRFPIEFSSAFKDNSKDVNCWASFSEENLNDVSNEIEKGWQSLQELIPKIQQYLKDSNTVHHNIQRIKDSQLVLGEKVVEALRNNHVSNFQTIVHGDFRTENVFFVDDQQEKLKIVDWQGVSLGDYSVDLSTFLTTCLKPSFRSQHEKHLLQVYQSSLNEHIISSGSICPSIDEVIASFQRSIWLDFSFILIAIAKFWNLAPIEILKDKLGRYFFLLIEMVERVLSAFVEHHL